MKSSSSLSFWLWIKYQWRQLGRKSSNNKHPWPWHQWDICVFQKCLFPDNNKITTRLFIFDWTKPTYIQPSNLSIKLHPSSVLWGIQTIKRSRPATTNWEDLSVTPPYDFPGFHATPSVCRPGSLPSLQNFRSLLSWSPLNCWLRSKSGAFFGVGVLLTCQNSTLTKYLEKWCLSQFLLNSTEDISVWHIKVSGSEVRVEIQVWCWSNTIGWPRTWSGSFKLQWRHQWAWYTPSCSCAAFGLQETAVPTKGLGKRNHEGGYECIFATKNKVGPKVGIFVTICACNV